MRICVHPHFFIWTHDALPIIFIAAGPCSSSSAALEIAMCIRKILRARVGLEMVSLDTFYLRIMSFAISVSTCLLLFFTIAVGFLEMRQIWQQIWLWGKKYLTNGSGSCGVWLLVMLRKIAIIICSAHPQHSSTKWLCSSQRACVPVAENRLRLPFLKAK